MSRKPAWKDYGWRVGRTDAITLIERGHDYPVHAAMLIEGGTFKTACGRTLHLAFGCDSPSTYTSCRSCLRVLGNH